MGPSIRLNADAGEGSRHDRALIPLLDRVSVACGGHAGTAATMRSTVALAARYGVAVGAHPSYPDREGFGRRKPRGMSSHALFRSVRAQIAALGVILRRRGLVLDHVKFHGALYHELSADPALAGEFASVVLAAGQFGPRGYGSVAWVGPPGSGQEAAARRRGLAFLREGFADRAYRRDGTLVPRDRPGALLRPRAAVAQARRLALSGGYDTLCVHSDTPGCVAIARALRARSR